MLFLLNLQINIIAMKLHFSLIVQRTKSIVDVTTFDRFRFLFCI